MNDPFDQDKDEAQPYRLDDELRTELARKVVTHEMLVADITRDEWQISLGLLFAGLSAETLGDIGLVLVPMKEHMGGPWINGVAPGCTTKATLIHNDDVFDFGEVVGRMDAALGVVLDGQQEAGDD